MRALGLADVVVVLDHALVGVPLGRRLKQTLSLLMIGLSEKEVALELALSTHTVHVYIKHLYRVFGVCSRSELLAHVFVNYVVRDGRGQRRRLS